MKEPEEYLYTYELSGIPDEHIVSTKNFEITTCCNIDDNLLYFKLWRFDYPYKKCRIFLDKPEYFYSDFYLTKKEKEELLSILPNIWEALIKENNIDREREELKLINNDIPIPEYKLLKTED